MRRDGLPKYVSQYFDRHGRLRQRYRRTGYAQHSFQNLHPTRAFWEEYDACQSGVAPKRSIGLDRVTPGSIAELVGRFLGVPARLGPSSVTQAKNRAILNKFREQHGHRMVADATFEALDAIISAKATATPVAAQKLRKQLKKLFAFAVKLRLIEQNPVDETEPVKVVTKGFHSWTEAEIAQFTERHPVGTKAHLAMMLMLWTFQRRGDAVRMKPSDITKGRIAVRQGKTAKALEIRVAPQLAAAIAARPAGSPDQPFLLTEFGKPFTGPGFGNWFRKRCDEAGLPQCSAHGLRKAAARRAAELGLSNSAIKSVTGHSDDKEVSVYTAAASQSRLADRAIDELAAHYLANVENRLDKDA